jgi:hypothetical protein
MAVAQWNSFAYYIVGDEVQNGSSVRYGCILINTNQPPPNPIYWNDLTPVAAGLLSLQALTIADNGGNLTLTSPTATFTTVPSTGTINMAIAYPPVPPNATPYTLSGTTAGAITVFAPIGNTNPFPQNIFTLVYQVTFNLPVVIGATDSLYYDGYLFSDWVANFNSFWGVSYATNTFPTFTDILGSTTDTNKALQFSNFNQIYLPLNIIFPPTHLTSGGTLTLKVFCRPTSINQYLTAIPTKIARIGIVSD